MLNRFIVACAVRHVDLRFGDNGSRNGHTLQEASNRGSCTWFHKFTCNIYTAHFIKQINKNQLILYLYYINCFVDVTRCGRGHEALRLFWHIHFLIKHHFLLNIGICIILIVFFGMDGRAEDRTKGFAARCKERAPLTSIASAELKNNAVHDAMKTHLIWIIFATLLSNLSTTYWFYSRTSDIFNQLLL